MRYITLIFISIMLTACGANAETVEEIDFEADLVAYSTEAAQLREDTIIGRTEIAQNVAIASTQSADYERYNQSLRATTVVVIPPTSDARIVANQVSGPLPEEVYDLSDGEMRFVQIGPAGQIDENDCFLEKQQFYNQDAGAVYATAVALNLRAGTTVTASWQYGSELVYTNSWVAPQSDSYRCISLPLFPSNAEFLAGNWSVTLTINGNPGEPRAFTILNG